MAGVLMEQIKRGLKAGTYRLCTSSLCSRIVQSPKAEGPYRICIDCRPINMLIKKGSGGIGDIPGMFDQMKVCNNCCRSYSRASPSCPRVPSCP